MPTIIGQIGTKKTKNYKDKPCNIVQIITQQGRSAYVEFRNQLKRFSDKLEKDQSVKVEYTYDGKESKSGQHYNNLIATSVEKL